MVLDPILLSRIQFAFTVSFHIIFPTLTIGLGLFIVFWEALWLKTRKKLYYQLCKFWITKYALSIGMGIVSGIVLSYEFGTNFSKFIIFSGNIVGPIISYEVLTAFFLEAGFMGIMFFGWKRVSPAMHFTATCLVVFGTILSAFWILAANSWMHTPQGFEEKNNILYAVNWLEIALNPSFPYRFIHMLNASFLSASFVVAATMGWYLARDSHDNFAKVAFKHAIYAIILLAPLQIFLGDLHGLNTEKHQPMKIAAMEGRWETMNGAPLILFAIPNQDQESNSYEIAIPKLASLILTHELDGEVKGLKEVVKEDRPPVGFVFYSFRVMVGIGFLFLFTAITAIYLIYKKQLFKNIYFFRWLYFMAPLGFVATLAGWYTTEVGRQPWVIHGLMRTKDAASDLPPESVLFTLILFIIVYSTLFVSYLIYYFKSVKKGPMEVSEKDMHQLTAWLEGK